MFLNILNLLLYPNQLQNCGIAKVIPILRIADMLKSISVKTICVYLLKDLSSDYLMSMLTIHTCLYYKINSQSQHIIANDTCDQLQLVNTI